MSKAELLSEFGSETVEWMLSMARGEDSEPVLARFLPVSIGCSKSFRQSNMLFWPDHFFDGTIFKVRCPDLSTILPISGEAKIIMSILK